MSNIENIVNKQREFFQTGQTKDFKYRQEQLQKLYKALKREEPAIMQALNDDLNKSNYESYITEIGVVYEELKYITKRFMKWSKPKRVKTPITLFKSKSYIYPEPYGVVLIMSPWNYPFQLTILPLIGAIAAGNCAILKPSNYSNNTSKIIAKIVSENFNENYLTVILGGREENQELLKQKFDYIFFTGSTNVGKVVMEAASKHLTPISLELGGKSPCIVDETANLIMAAKRIVWGKFLNAGQTCVAPDYLLVHHTIKDKLVEYLNQYIKNFFPNKGLFPKIINQHHYYRLIKLIENEEIIIGGKSNDQTLQIEPTILDNINWNSLIMQEEIFGPLLPIITYDSLDEIIISINQRPKPLALYIFSNSKKNQYKIINSISYGGGCINDTVVHLGNSYLPFGGVGESGMGSYHGRATFNTFSHHKSILKTSNLVDIPFRYPPFNKRLKLVKRIMK